MPILEKQTLSDRARGMEMEGGIRAVLRTQPVGLTLPPHLPAQMSHFSAFSGM